MKKPNIYEFDTVIYPRHLWVSIDAPTSALNELFPEGDTLDAPFVDMADKTNAITDRVRKLTPEPQGGILIRFKSVAKMTPPIMAHEAFHAMMGILDYINSYPAISNQEPAAYLIEFIVKCCEKAKSYYEKELSDGK